MMNCSPNLGFLFDGLVLTLPHVGIGSGISAIVGSRVIAT
jgi:hypothetical protein